MTVLLEYFALLDSDFTIRVHQCVMCIWLLCLVNGRGPLKDEGIKVASSSVRARFYNRQFPCSSIMRRRETNIQSVTLIHFTSIGHI